MSDLESIEPGKAKELFIAQRRDEVSEKTQQGYGYRLKPFVQWCESNGLHGLNDLTARKLHEYRLRRKDDGNLKKITLRGQLSTLHPTMTHRSSS